MLMRIYKVINGKVKETLGENFVKKILLPIALLFTLSVGTVCAAPIKDLYLDQTAMGLSLNTQHSGFYIENKITYTMTGGYEYAEVGSKKFSDLYSKFDLKGGVKGMGGMRDVGGNGGLKMYGGLGLSIPLDYGWDGYISLVGNLKDFSELQVGANYVMFENVDLNINYRVYQYQGYNTAATIGVVYKF